MAGTMLLKNKKNVSFTLITLLMMSSSCAFKKNQTDAQIGISNKIKIPGHLKIESQNTTYVLIDVIDMSESDYDIDLTLLPKGDVFFPKQTPKFKDTECSGLGYEVSYEPDQQIVTSQLKLVPFVDGNERDGDHLIVSAKNRLKIGVYSAFLPISDYLETENLPTEFTKSFQPSNQCHYMCDRTAGVKPIRPLKYVFGQYDCYYYAPTTPSSRTRTDDLDFYLPDLRGGQAQLDYYLNRLKQCDAVQNNDDLKNYYDQLTKGPCYQGVRKEMYREWYFVELKVPFEKPLYTISNYHDVIKSTTVTQTSVLEKRPIHPLRDWDI